MVFAAMLASVLVVLDDRPDDWDLVTKLTVTGYAADHAISHCGNVTHLAYADRPIHYEHGLQRIAYVRSKDRGSSWSPVQILSPDPIDLSGWGRRVKIACAANEVHVIWSAEVWMETSTGFHVRHILQHRASLDGGQSWEDLQILNEVIPFRPNDYDVQVSEDLVIVAWTEDLSFFSSYEVVWYVTSLNRGINWSDQRILHHQYGHHAPRIVIEGGAVYTFPKLLESGDALEYVGGMLMVSEDLTESWDYIDIEQELGLNDLRVADLARRGDELVVTSKQGLLRSEDGGMNWTIDTDNVIYGSLAGQGDLLVAGYCSGEQNMLSRDFGTTWEEITFPLPDDSMFCDWSIDETRLLLVYTLRSVEGSWATWEIHLAESDDHGETWSAPKQVTDHFSVFNVAFLAIAVGGIVVTSLLIAIWGAREYAQGREGKRLRGQQLRLRWFSDARSEELAPEKPHNPDGLECSSCQSTRMYVCDDGSGICLDCRQAFAESPD